jgi:hypothetical protein
MKLTITWKTPDAGDYAIREAAEDALEGRTDLDSEERAWLIQEQAEALSEALTQWVQYGELITIEFDLTAGTATVLER